MSKRRLELLITIFFSIVLVECLFVYWMTLTQHCISPILTQLIRGKVKLKPIII